MVNILSGGLHAEHGMDVQDFLFIPASAKTIESIKSIGKCVNLLKNVSLNCYQSYFWRVLTGNRRSNI